MKYGVDVLDLVARNINSYPQLNVDAMLRGGTALVLPSGGEHTDAEKMLAEEEAVKKN